MPTLLVTHPAFLHHDTGHYHPERPDRMRAIDKILGHEIYADLTRRDAPIRDDVEEAILRAHPVAHLEAIKRADKAAQNSLKHLDPDTVMSKGTWEAAIRAVGAGLQAVDEVFDEGNDIKNAFCQVRPPGHHAEKDRVMGFCFFGNAAIAAHYAREKYGAERIAVVDFDVHHGNGTQDIFWSNKDLYYASTHQMPLFPGTGALSETGDHKNIWNAPLRAGDGGEKFRQAFEERILGSINDFSPDLVVISAGFDAHKDDPLASLELVEADYLWATEKLCGIAARHCDGRVVSMLEGGYDLTALARSVGVHVRALMQAGA